MRIAFDVTPLCAPASGVGTYTLHLLQHLSRRNEDEMLPLAHRPVAFDTIAERNPDLPQPVSGLPFGLNKTIWMQAVLPWLLARLRADICHFTNAVASLWTPCPTVVTVHDMTLWLYPQHHYRRRLLAMRPFVPPAAHRAAAIIAVSQATKADIVRILDVDEAKVHVVHEAPAPHFRPLEAVASLEGVRQHYGLPDRFLLYVGTIEPRKNLVRLLEVLARLRRSEGLDHGLVLVGHRGWKDEEVFATVERLALGDATQFLGYVPTEDLVALYNLAEALVYPSLYEGFGLPVLEAMACGTPVVASSSGSLQEVAGSAAEFVDPRDEKHIAAGLQRVLLDADRREELRALGLAQAAHFSWDAAARQTRRIYDQAVAAGTASP